MANDIQSSVWVLDTPTASVVLPTNVKVDHIEFVGYTNPTDQAILVNSAGKLVAQLSGAADFQEVRTGKIGWVTGGIRLQSISSGKVLVYIG